MKKKALAVFALFTAAFHSPPEVHAQSIGPSTLDAAGGSAVIGGNTHEYAVGQAIMTPTFISATLVVTPGVLQPAQSPNSIDRVTALDGVSIFPNPVTTDLYVAPALGSRGLLEMRLLDAAGKLIRKTDARLNTGSERQTINMESLATGSYLLKLTWTPEGVKSASASAFTVQKTR